MEANAGLGFVDDQEHGLERLEVLCGEDVYAGGGLYGAQ